MAETKKAGHGLRKFLIILAGLAVFFAAAVAVTPLFIPWEKLKARAEREISGALHHPVTVGSMGFNIFKGIIIQNIRVGNAQGFSAEPLLSDDAVIVQYRLLPLLAGKVMIKAVILEKPVVLVEKSTDGVFNFSDMIPAKASQTAPALPAAEGKTTPPSALPNIPLALLVSRVAVHNAVLTYRDLKSKQTYAVEAFNLEIKNLTLAGLTPVEVLLSTDIKAMGAVIPLKVDTAWRFQYAQEKFLLDRFNAHLPGVALGVQGEVDQVLGAPALNLAGNLQADFGVLLAAAGPALSAKLPAGFKLAGTAKVDFKAAGPAKEIGALEVAVADQVDAHLALQGLNLPVQVNGKLSLAKANVNLTQDITLPKTQAELAKDVHASGQVQIKASIQGLQDPKKMGLALQVMAKNLAAEYQNKPLLENLNATLEVAPDKVNLPSLQGKLGGQPVQFSLSAKGFDLRDASTLKPAALKAQVAWSLESPMLDVDALLALMPGKKTGAGGEATAPAAPADKAQTGKEPEANTLMPPGLGLAGSARLGGLKFGKVKLGKMVFKLDLKKQVLNETGDIAGYDGGIHETVRLDFAQSLLGYGVRAELKNVDVEPLLNDVVDTFVAAKLKKPEIISEIKDKLTGHLTGTLDLNGAGITPEVAKPKLAGKGVFNLKNGRIRKFSFQDKLADLFKSDKFRQDIPFDNTAIEFAIARQVVDLTRFDMSSGPDGLSGDIRLAAQGKIKFTADFEDFRLRPALSPRSAAGLSSEFSRYSEVLKDDKGWTVIPVIMNGPVNSPTVLPDWEWIKKQFGGYAGRKVQHATQEAGKKLQNFVDQQKGKSAEEIGRDAGQELEKAKDQLKNLDGLKNLFK